MAAKKRKKRKTRSSKKRGTWGRRLLLLCLFLLAAGVVFWQRGDLWTGLRVHARPWGTEVEIGDVNGLARSEKRSPGVVKVRGIPDYESRLRLLSGNGRINCFRMVGFENRLFVCSDRPLEEPEGIEDVLRERRFTGFLEPLSASRFREPLRQGFLKERGIRPAAGAQLLREGSLVGPSLLKTLLLAACVLLCIFFLFRFILSFKA